MECSVCRLPKADYRCELCEKQVCKRCSHKSQASRLEFLPEVPEKLTKERYCGPCFDAEVAPVLHDYELTLAKARDLNVFYKGQGEETRRYRRTEKPLQVDRCGDRAGALLRLAFLAARAGFNCLLDVHITVEKSRNAGFQKNFWFASGVPTNLELAEPIPGKVLLKRE